jgi:hypothetical protein
MDFVASDLLVDKGELVLIGPLRARRPGCHKRGRRLRAAGVKSARVVCAMPAAGVGSIADTVLTWPGPLATHSMP